MTGENFLLVTEEMKYLFGYKLTPENTQAKTSYAASSKLFINIFYAHWKMFKGLWTQLGKKHACKFVLGYYLFLKAHSFPWALPLENCGTGKVSGQISMHMFATNRGYCLLILWSSRCQAFVILNAVC